jgi:acyl-CoA synthetase (AMP-forming)/AMP-acid ligase II
VVVGEMAISEPEVCTGYFNNPEETSRNLRSGWFVSNNLVKRDVNCFFFVVYRRTCMMKVDRLKVLCTEIEPILRAHQGVEKVAVVRVLDESHDKLPKAFVVPAPGLHTMDASKKGPASLPRRPSGPLQAPQTLQIPPGACPAQQRWQKLPAPALEQEF